MEGNGHVATFYGEADDNGYLSNWFGAPFEFAGHVFPTSEHWMMWQKARLFGDMRTAAEVLGANGPAEAKRLGRRVTPFVNAAWSEVRMPVMVVGLRQKFAQNDRLLDQLLSTGASVLAEAAPHDSVWGIGLDRDDPKSVDPGEWRGSNLQGRALMTVRSQLRTLLSKGGSLEWGMDAVRESPLWDMSLLELARIPSTRPAALMYATYVSQARQNCQDAHDVLRRVRASLGELEQAIYVRGEDGVPAAGWHEFLDELAIQLCLEGIKNTPSSHAEAAAPSRVGDAGATAPAAAAGDAAASGGALEDTYWDRLQNWPEGASVTPQAFFEADDLAFLEWAANSDTADAGAGLSLGQGVEPDVARLSSLVLEGDFDAFVNAIEYGPSLKRACNASGGYRRVVVLGLALGVASGHDGCATFLGGMYYMGEVIRQDYCRAKRLYEIADGLGNMMATVNLGYVFEYGRCGDPDYDAAYRQYAKAASVSGHYEALYKLGDMYARGHSVARDVRTAFALYEKSLSEAEGIAQQCQAAFRIAELISDRENGPWGVPYDPMGALGLYQLAERGMRIQIASGETHYLRRLQAAIQGQGRMREVLDDPGFWASGGEGRERRGDSMEKTTGRLVDAVWGAAVGDALGVPYEFKARDTFECGDMVGHGTHDQPAGTWSDDTALLLATCDSVRRTGRVDAEDLLASFRRWFREGAYTPDGVVFDVGNATSEALRTGVGLTGEWDNGNGSLMRIAPLAFCDATDDEVRAASAVTHAHATSTEACVEFVHLLREVAEDPVSARDRLRTELAGIPRADVRSGGYVLDTLLAAKWCFANTSSYRECVLAAVNLGKDTDTTACVAGALAGTAYGLDAIPQEWVEAMRGKDVLEASLF